MTEAVVVLQARMGSTRLPGKVLAMLGSYTLLGHCIRRLQAAAVGPVVVATTVGSDDDVIEAEAMRLGSTVVRGSADDVLARFVLASTAVPARWVVRATADNPAVDMGSARRLLRMLDDVDADFAMEVGFPYGGAVEVIAATTLLRVSDLATDAYDREHVTPYLKRHADTFRIVTPDAPPDVWRPDLRLTVDTMDDLDFMRLTLQRAEAECSPAPLNVIIAAADAVRRQEAS